MQSMDGGEQMNLDTAVGGAGVAAVVVSAEAGDSGWADLDDTGTALPPISQGITENSKALAPTHANTRADDDEVVVTDDWDEALDGQLQSITLSRERERLEKIRSEERQRQAEEQEKRIAAAAAAAAKHLQPDDGTDEACGVGAENVGLKTRHALLQTDPEDIIEVMNVHGSSGYDYTERLRRLRQSLNMPQGVREETGNVDDQQPVLGENTYDSAHGGVQPSPSRTEVHLSYFAAVRDLAHNAADTGHFGAADKLYSGAIGAFTQAQQSQKDDDSNIDVRLEKLKARFISSPPTAGTVVTPNRILTSKALDDQVPGVFTPSKLVVDGSFMTPMMSKSGGTQVMGEGRGVDGSRRVFT